MEQSETIGKLTAAMVKVQETLRGYTEKSKNPHFKSKYGSLTDVWAAIREPLTSNGLAVIQTMDNGDEGFVTVVTTLAHSSGEWIRGKLKMPYGRGSGPQAAGSAITYARRYALAAIVGVAPEDDDAEAAEGRGRDGGRQGETGRESGRQGGGGNGGDPNRAALMDLWRRGIAAGKSKAWMEDLVHMAGVEKGQPVTVAALATVEKQVEQAEVENER